MKQCPACDRTYDDSQSFCLMDGTSLIIESGEKLLRQAATTIVMQTSPSPFENGTGHYLIQAGFLSNDRGEA